YRDRAGGSGSGQRVGLRRGGKRRKRQRRGEANQGDLTDHRFSSKVFNLTQRFASSPATDAPTSMPPANPAAMVAPHTGGDAGRRRRLEPQSRPASVRNLQRRGLRTEFRVPFCGDRLFPSISPLAWTLAGYPTSLALRRAYS